MSHNSIFTSDAQKSAYIRDDALILYFESAETPLVARFDLDSLVQANFEVSKKDELFALVLRDFSGQRQEITTFANKADAHQALYAILQALLSYGENKKGNATGPNLLWKFIKGLLIGAVLAILIAGGLAIFSTPVHHAPSTETLTQEKDTAPTVAKEDPVAPVTAETPAAIPEGEPMNMEDFVAPALQSLASESIADPAPAEQVPADASSATTP